MAITQEQLDSLQQLDIDQLRNLIRWTTSTVIAGIRNSGQVYVGVAAEVVANDLATISDEAKRLVEERMAADLFELPDWARCDDPYQEHLDHEFGARYDRYTELAAEAVDPYAYADDLSEDYPGQRISGPEDDRRGAATLHQLHDDDDIPF